MNIKPGDIFCSAPRLPSNAAGEQLLSASIIRATQTGPWPTPSHAFMSVNEDTIVEATWPVTRDRSIKDYLLGDYQLWQMRWASISNNQREAMAAKIWLRQKEKYPIAQLIFDGEDKLFDSRNVTRIFDLFHLFVCSGLVADVSKQVAGQGFRDPRTGDLLRPTQVTPADITDNARIWPDTLQPVWDNLTDADHANAAKSWEEKVTKAKERSEWETYIASTMAGP